MNTTLIIRHCEKLWTAIKRCGVSEFQDERRREVLMAFERMATDLGKLARAYAPADWNKVHEKVHLLHSEAVTAEERAVGTFAHAGSVSALVGPLHALAHTLGYRLSDVDCPAEEAAEPVTDDATRSHVEHHEVRDAAE